jgi:hypothetical protein
VFSNPRILEPTGFWELTLLVEHTVTTFKMYLSRRFARAVAVISLLIVLSTLAVISLGEGFELSYFGRGGSRVLEQSGNERMQVHCFCPFYGSKFEHCPNTISAQVTDGRTISWQRSTKDTKDDVEDASNDVVTITVCTTVDSLPTTAIGPVSALPGASQSSTGPLNASLANVGLINTASISGGSVCNSSPSTLPACGLLPTSVGYVCQYYPPTVFLFLFFLFVT